MWTTNHCFADVLGMPTVWIPHSYPACSQHAPNEHLLASVAREGLAIGTRYGLDPAAMQNATQAILRNAKIQVQLIEDLFGQSIVEVHQEIAAALGTVVIFAGVACQVSCRNGLTCVYFQAPPASVRLTPSGSRDRHSATEIAACTAFLATSRPRAA